jgi:type VI secretion system protein VasG
MLTVDIRSLLGRLNPFCTRCLESAAGLCVSRSHYEVTLEHFLAKVIDDPQADLSLILHHFGIDPGKFAGNVDRTLEEFKRGNAAKPVFSPLLLEWFQDAWLITSVDQSETKIRSGSLLISLLMNPGRFTSGRFIDIIETISLDALKADFWNVLKHSNERQASAELGAAGEALPPRDATALGRFCVDFTAKAKAGEIDPVFGRDREIRQMVDILARRRKNNPIVVGEAGVGKTAVVEGLALRVVEDDVPELLRNVSILGLDMGLLQAGAGMKGEFENRLKSVISEIKASAKPIILFIDEAHTLIGAGGAAGQSDAANLLKPALARGELRTVAATTWSEYKKYFEKDPALARRFQLVKLEEPSRETATLILRGLKEKYEDAHGVIVRDDAIVAAAELASRYITGRQLPDKAVDLLDTSAARVKVLLTAKPDIIEDHERTVQALTREHKAIDRDRLHGLPVEDERLLEITKELEKLDETLNILKERWHNEQEIAFKLIAERKELFTLKAQNLKTDEGQKQVDQLEEQLAETTRQMADLQGDDPLIRIEVDPDVVAKVVSDWTGIPLGRVMRDQATDILHLEERLQARIKGQDGGLALISEVIKAAKSGLKDPSQPLGIFLLVGPSGVGKTETALALADLLFGGERFVTSINMSEFQEKHTLSRLIGSPPGYVGYGEGGVLTEAVRQRPYSVVLLDEVEKASLDVMNLFYQVFDKGSLSDGEGRNIDFKNTIIFLTSNLATDVITELCSTDEPLPAEAMMSAIRPILNNHFKPALLARMTVVPYMILPHAILNDIVVLKLNKLAARMAETHKINFTYSNEVIQQISARCTEVETGARNIDHIMNGTVLPQMSKEILVRMSAAAMPENVCLDIDPQGEFSIHFQGDA